jgi:hypothetical protein
MVALPLAIQQAKWFGASEAFLLRAGGGFEIRDVGCGIRDPGSRMKHPGCFGRRPNSRKCPATGCDHNSRGADSARPIPHSVSHIPDSDPASRNAGYEYSAGIGRDVSGG